MSVPPLSLGQLYVHPVSSRVDDEIAFLHDEGSPIQEVGSSRLDGRVLRVGVSSILRFPTEQVWSRTSADLPPALPADLPVERDPGVVPFTSEKMSLDKEVWVVLVQARVGVIHSEEWR
jgi:hypothetical protein